MPPARAPLPSRRAFAAAAAFAPALRAFAQAPAAPPFLLEAGEAELRLRAAPKPASPAWTYNGGCPGPALRVKQGEELLVQLRNSLHEATTIHWKGMRNAARDDGVAGLSAAALAAGETRALRLSARDAGTFLYQPCLQGRTAAQIERGLYGLLIVAEKNPPAADLDLPVVIDDWRLDEAGAILEPAPASGRTPRLGNLLTVNGAPKAAEATIPVGGRARLRFANASATTIVALRFEGSPATIIAIDGQPTSSAFQPKRGLAILTPGGRLDAMVDLPGEEGETFRALVQLSDEVAPPVLALKSAGARRAALPPVAALPANEMPTIDLARALRVPLPIEGGPGETGSATPWRLAGRNEGVRAAKPLFEAKRGRTVVLAFENRTRMPQAVHLHGHHGRLLFSFDDGYDPFWIDTALVPPGRTARLAFVADNPGRWALRSAFAELFDAGMAGWFSVI